MASKKGVFFKLFVCFSILLALAACSLSPASPPDPVGTGSDGPRQTGPEPSPENTPEPSPEPSLEPTSEIVPGSHMSPYLFGVPLDETEPVADDSFFDSAVFLGDSRTEGLELFSGLTHGDFYWARGMTVFRADSEEYKIFEVNGQNLTLIGALSQKPYDSVYIMIGVNELGYPVSSYETGMAQLVDKVLAAQPDAVVYLQLLPPVNESVAKEKGIASYINNKRVDAFNEILVRIAAEKQVVLLDVASAFRDSDGQLPAGLTSDGVHFSHSGYSLWADYLRCHVMNREQYFYSREVNES